MRRSKVILAIQVFFSLLHCCWTNTTVATITDILPEIVWRFCRFVSRKAIRYELFSSRVKCDFHSSAVFSREVVKIIVFPSSEKWAARVGPRPVNDPTVRPVATERSVAVLPTAETTHLESGDTARPLWSSPKLCSQVCLTSRHTLSGWSKTNNAINWTTRRSLSSRSGLELAANSVHQPVDDAFAVQNAFAIMQITPLIINQSNDLFYFLKYLYSRIQFLARLLWSVDRCY